MKNFKNLLICFTVGMFSAGCFVLGYFTKVWTTPREINAIEDILEIIENEYVGGDFERDEFIRAAVNGTLDIYSEYYSPVDYGEVELDRVGEMQGKVGISFLSGGDSNEIYGVSGNSPAEHAGVKKGGKVIGIRSKSGDYTDIASYSEFMAACEVFKKGEEFTLVVDYGGEQTEYTLAKEDFIESYVWYEDKNGAYNSVMLEGKWAMQKSKNPPESHIIEGFSYLKLSRFNGDAAAQIKAALGIMKEAGNTDLILDLRSNGGGYMDVLTDITGYFIPGKNKQTVSVVEYKSGKKTSFSTDKNTYSEYGFTSITILANSGTASASEALIGAVLDYDKSYGKNIVRVIVTKSGSVESTYGKGIMQSTYKISGGGAFKLTTAKIYWPVSGICIHGKGINEATDERVRAVERSAEYDAELMAAMGGRDSGEVPS